MSQFSIVILHVRNNTGRVIRSYVKQISELSFQQQKKILDNNQFQSYLTLKHYNKLVHLVGPKSMIKCYIEGKSQNILWDTGANVSLIDRSNLHQHFPDTQIREMSDLLSDVNGLEVRWGNQSRLPFIGWVELKVSLTQGVDPDVIVPFLVTPDPLEHPILGTNAIEFLTEGFSKPALSTVIRQALSEKPEHVTELVNFIYADKTPEISAVKTLKKKVIIPTTRKSIYQVQNRQSIFR